LSGFQIVGYQIGQLPICYVTKLLITKIFVTKLLITKMLVTKLLVTNNPPIGFNLKPTHKKYAHSVHSLTGCSQKIQTYSLMQSFVIFTKKNF